MDAQTIISTIISLATQGKETSFSKEAERDLCRLAQVATYRKGDILLPLGEELTHVGFVGSGVIRSYYLSVSGAAMTKYFYELGTCVFDEALIGYSRSLCAYEALEDCEIYLLPAAEAKALILSSAPGKDLYISILEKSLQYKIARENAFLTQTATQRYLTFREEHKDLGRRLPNAVIATYLGITPESLSRIRRTLRDDNKEDFS